VLNCYFGTTATAAGISTDAGQQDLTTTFVGCHVHGLPGRLTARWPPADAGTHGATLTFAPARDGILTLRVWSKDRAGRFSAPVTWIFFVKAATQPQPVGPLTPAISFPEGNTTVQGACCPSGWTPTGARASRSSATAFIPAPST
jgi:hypothetical protein